MERRRFLLTSLAGVLAAPLAAEGQQAAGAYRVGILTNRASDPAEDARGEDYVEAGGLMSYSPDYDILYRRGAIYVDKI